MCINIKTSIYAFLIGTLSSLILNKNKNKENNRAIYYILYNGSII